MPMCYGGGLSGIGYTAGFTILVDHLRIQDLSALRLSPLPDWPGLSAAIPGGRSHRRSSTAMPRPVAKGLPRLLCAFARMQANWVLKSTVWPTTSRKQCLEIGQAWSVSKIAL